MLNPKKDIMTFIKSYNIYLIFKIVEYKLYEDLIFLLISTYYWKDLLIDMIIDFQILTS